MIIPCPDCGNETLRFWTSPRDGRTMGMCTDSSCRWMNPIEGDPEPLMRVGKALYSKSEYELMQQMISNDDLEAAKSMHQIKEVFDARVVFEGEEMLQLETAPPKRQRVSVARKTVIRDNDAQSDLLTVLKETNVSDAKEEDELTLL